MDFWLGAITGSLFGSAVAIVCMALAVAARWN